LGGTKAGDDDDTDNVDDNGGVISVAAYTRGGGDDDLDTDNVYDNGGVILVAALALLSFLRFLDPNPPLFVWFQFLPDPFFFLFSPPPFSSFTFSAMIADR